MPLITRKLLFLFLLNNIIFCNLMGQLPLPVGGVVGLIMLSQKKAKPVKVFKTYKFDSSDIILGIDYSDTANVRYANFSFIVDNTRDLAELKKTLVVTNSVDPVMDQRAFNIYHIRNKEVKKSWHIFPELKSMLTDNGFNSFDTSILANLHSKRPLAYRIQIDTLKNKALYLRFKDSVKTVPSLLFLIEPSLYYEGSFEVKAKAGFTKNIEKKINNICNKIKPESPFKVEEKEGDKSGDAKNMTYIIWCKQSLFEQFSNIDIEKSDWIPIPIFVKSYWRE